MSDSYKSTGGKAPRRVNYALLNDLHALTSQKDADRVLNCSDYKFKVDSERFTSKSSELSARFEEGSDLLFNETIHPPEVVLGFCYFVYTGFYLGEPKDLQQLLEAFCPGWEIKYDMTHPLFHAGLFDLGTRYGLSNLQDSAKMEYMQWMFVLRLSPDDDEPDSESTYLGSNNAEIDADHSMAEEVWGAFQQGSISRDTTLFHGFIYFLIWNTHKVFGSLPSWLNRKQGTDLIPSHITGRQRVDEIYEGMRPYLLSFHVGTLEGECDECGEAKKELKGCQHGFSCAECASVSSRLDDFCPGCTYWTYSKASHGR